MHRLSKKLLTIVLTLLLGLSPLQGTMAGFAPSPDQGWSMDEMTDRHDGGRVMAADNAVQDCDRCPVADSNTAHACSSGQCCASCIMAVTQASSQLKNMAASPELFRALDGAANQLSSSFFRPPRV